MTLVLEAIVAGLALPVIATTGAGTSSFAFYHALVLMILFIIAAGLQRRPWGLSLALGLQILMIVALPFAPAVGVLGLVFALVWGYLLWLRRDVQRRLAAGEQPPPGE